MITRTHIATVLASSVALLGGVGAAMAIASPDGDDDPAFNATGANGFGTQYSLVADQNRTYGRPVTTRAPDGASVTATLVAGDSPTVKITRFDQNGQPSGLGGTGTVTLEIKQRPFDFLSDLLDIRVVDGQVVLLFGGTTSYFERTVLQVERVDYATGELDDNVNQTFSAPEDCEADDIEITRGGGVIGPSEDQIGLLEAARVKADGGAYALWTCYDEEDFSPFRADGDRTAYPNQQTAPGDVYATSYSTSLNGEEVDSVRVDDTRQDDFGEDLEISDAGDPYVLTGTYFDREGRGRGDSYSRVYHLTAETDGTDLVKADPEDGSDPISGLPVDLAVDHQARPVVWTEPQPGSTRGGPTAQDWIISRLTPDLEADESWGTDGTTTLTDERLGVSSGSKYYCGGFKNSFLTVRPDDRILATGPLAGPGYYQNPNCFFFDRSAQPREANRRSAEAIIVGLTTAGAVDTGFADAGYKVLTYPDSGADTDTVRSGFHAIGEPVAGSDQKILVPHTTYRTNLNVTTNTVPTNTVTVTETTERIAAPPATADRRAYYLGVTRLNPSPAQQPQRQTQSTPSSPVAPSSVPAVCGRRAISLVRADVRGSKVKLTGVVGAAFYGKQVTIQTDPAGAKASGFSRTATVTASKRSGSFSVSVKRPSRAQFKSVRYRALVGKAKSPALKLPQSLTSRSVKSAAGTITVKGKVKRSVLGKRNKVTIRRLACGRYRTVGTAKPDASGNYTVTFKASAIRGVSFYRAESKVQVRPGSKKYAIQYARAIAIRTTGQTG